MRRWGTFFASLAILVVIFGTIYGTVQQSQRSAANMPQIQTAQDIANSLNQGMSPSVLVYGSVDISKSLAPFATIYDKSGNIVITSGYIDGKSVKAPIGILKASTGTDYHAVTWQPQDGVRIAAVTTTAKDYYVLSGRSLTEVEKNENTTFVLSLLGGLVATILLMIVFAITGHTRRR